MTTITNYRNLPAEHCGSGAMRNLLYYYCDLDLPEYVVFGLGSGLDCLYFEHPKLQPQYQMFGRSITMETDIGQALGLDYREQIETSDDVAWEKVRQEVDAGRPTMLSGDILYLDYRDYKVHFPGHRFVLLGYDEDEQVAYIGDRINRYPERCSLKALRISRNPPEGISTFNLWGKFHSTQITTTLEQAALHALKKSCQRMLGQDTSQSMLLSSMMKLPKDSVYGGVAGINALAQRLSDIAAQDQHDTDELQFLTSYLSRCIEKFGNGGGNFRRMYASFLHWIKVELDIDVSDDSILLAKASARLWTELSETLFTINGEEDSSGVAMDKQVLWQQAAGQCRNIAQLETQLFEQLVLVGD